MEEKHEIERLKEVIKNLEQKISSFETEKYDIQENKNEIRTNLEIQTEKFKFVTVLYSDVKGLTQLAQQTDVEFLIDELDRFYFHFDNLIEKYKIERIKSIGDTYLCAGGFPEKDKTNPLKIIIVALEMQQFYKKMQAEAKERNLKIWNITFGIHSGPVQVNKYGKRKIIYELSGDSLNIASRIESACEIDQICISGKTYETVKDFFVCEYKGKLPVKYKGELSLYIVKGYLPKLSIDNKGILPNNMFLSKLQMLAFDDLNEKILDYLEKNLPQELKYYDIKHTIDVSIAVEILGASENLNDDELLLLKTAALFHDTGIIYGYRNHEKNSVEISKRFLKSAAFSDAQIQVIENLILSTQNPIKANNILEKILCDADLEYLGRPDFIEIINAKFFDINLNNQNFEYLQWLNYNIEILNKYDFYTESAKNLMFISKEEQILKLNHEITNYNNLK